MRTFLRWLASGMFISAGTLHFANPRPFVRIVPPQIPWPHAAVYVSGAVELAGGLGLLIPPVRKKAAYGLCALLVAVFPANIYMATQDIQISRTFTIPLWAQWARLPLQPLLMWWVWSVREAK